MGIKISALPPVTDSSNLTLPANQAGVTSKVQTGVANGLPYLAGDNKIPIAFIPSSVIGALNYQGVWNANTNSPPLGNSGAGGVKGDYYVVSVAGSTSIDGVSDWKIGDWIVNNGATWDKIDNTDGVISVNGMTGIVSLNAADIPSTPANPITAPNVQGAINQLASVVLNNLLNNPPIPFIGQTIVRTVTYSLGLISNETWTLSGLALKSIDYTYSGGLLDTTIVKVYDSDGVTILAKTTETQAYSGGLDDGSSIVRDI